MKTNSPYSRFLAGRMLLTAIIALAASACGGNRGASNAPAGAAGAREMLSAFLKPGADLPSLSLALRPSAEDYTAVFADEFAAKLRAMYDPLWESGTFVLQKKEGQTELLLHAIPSDEINAWSRHASDHLPGGYAKIKDHFKSGLTIYAFSFVEPGESLGMSFDGLVHVNGKWRIFPKPFRAVR